MYLERFHFMLAKFQIDDISITLLTFDFYLTQVHGQDRQCRWSSYSYLFGLKHYQNLKSPLKPNQDYFGFLFCILLLA